VIEHEAPVTRGFLFVGGWVDFMSMLKPDYPHTYFNLGNAYNNVTSLGYHKIYI